MEGYMGIDIGGTKCAVVRGDEKGKIVEKVSFATREKETTLRQITETVRQLWSGQIKAIGVSCGGPLDSQKGVFRTGTRDSSVRP